MPRSRIAVPCRAIAAMVATSAVILAACGSPSSSPMPGPGDIATEVPTPTAIETPAAAPTFTPTPTPTEESVEVPRLPSTPTGRQAEEFTGIAKWLNSDPLTLEELRGGVVLIDFWTYSCINCLRTLPFLRDWNEKFAG